MLDDFRHEIAYAMLCQRINKVFARFSLKFQDFMACNSILYVVHDSGMVPVIAMNESHYAARFRCCSLNMFSRLSAVMKDIKHKDIVNAVLAHTYDSDVMLDIDPVNSPVIAYKGETLDSMLVEYDLMF